MGVVVVLIILSVGVFAFFTVMQNIPTTNEQKPPEEVINSIQNINDSANSVFNILGIVLILGVMMVVIGVIYSYMSPSSIPSSSEQTKTKEHKNAVVDEKKENNRTSIFKRKKEDMVEETLKAWKENHQELYERK